MNSYEEDKINREKSRLKYIADSDNMHNLINAVPEQRYGADVGFYDIEWYIERYRESYDGFDENPDFQRGHVWTEEQQIKFVEAFIRGTVGDTARTITLNCPDFQRDKVASDSDLKGFVVVDGLQRLTAVRRFMDDDFTIFNDVVEGGFNKNSFDGTRFNIKSLKGFRFNILNFQYKREVIKYYLAFNDGGTVHTKEEIQRVKNMLTELEGDKNG